MSKKRIIHIIVITLAALITAIILQMTVSGQFVGTRLEPTVTQLYKVVLPILTAP